MRVIIIQLGLIIRRPGPIHLPVEGVGVGPPSHRDPAVLFVGHDGPVTVNDRQALYRET